MKENTIIFIRALIKGITGFIVIPAEILVEVIKPGWETASVPVKFFTGLFFLPISFFVSLASPWWDDFDIA
jgi:hypothetical protein